MFIFLFKYPAEKLTASKRPESRVESYVKTQSELSMINDLYG